MLNASFVKTQDDSIICDDQNLTHPCPCLNSSSHAFMKKSCFIAIKGIKLFVILNHEFVDLISALSNLHMILMQLTLIPGNNLIFAL